MVDAAAPLQKRKADVSFAAEGSKRWARYSADSPSSSRGIGEEDRLER
jgi:hypothetical protein